VNANKPAKLLGSKSLTLGSRGKQFGRFIYVLRTSQPLLVSGTIHTRGVRNCTRLFIGRLEGLKARLPANGEWRGAEALWGKAIGVLQSRIQTRFLDSASLLRANRYAGFAILALDCLLLETIEAFRSGKRARNTGESRVACIRLLTSSVHFRQFFDDGRAGDFFTRVRNGLLHDGETRDGWLVKSAERYSLVQDLDGGYVVVNRNKFDLALEAEFRDYLTRLSVPENTGLRLTLDRALSDLCNRSRPKSEANSAG